MRLMCVLEASKCHVSPRRSKVLSLGLSYGELSKHDIVGLPFASRIHHHREYHQNLRLEFSLKLLGQRI